MSAIPSEKLDSGSGERILASGTTLGDAGRYRLVDIVAIGGMATIYRAEDERLGSHCALKALYLPGCDADVAAEFRNEARLLASLQFPGVVGVRDVFDEGDYGFLAMDFVEGQNLYDLHRRTGRQGENADDLPISEAPEDQVVLYALALARTLQYLHSRNPAIVHRDMKPHNVMRRLSDGSLVLLDFGIARTLDGESCSCVNDELGTPGYAAPEQYQTGATIDSRVDIYGLGVLLVELATGYNPRADGAERFVPSLSSLRSRISPTLTEILQRCVERDPGQRYQRAEDLIDALERWRRTPHRLRRKSSPTQIWSVETIGRACGALQAIEGRVYAADSSGACYAIDSATGHVDFELSSDVNRTPDMRYRLIPPSPGKNRASRIGRIRSSVRGSQLDLCSDELALLQVFDSAPGRIAAAWTMSSDLVLATTDPARVTRLSRGSDERWHQRWGSKLPCSPASIAPCGDDALVFLSDGTVLRVDRDGDRVWKTALPLWTRSAPSVVNIHGEIIVVAAARGDAPLTAIGLSTGNVLWQNAGAGQIVADTLLSADGSHLLSATRDTAFNLLRISDGEIVDRHRDFVRPLVGAAHFMPASSVLVLTEYGSGGRVALYDYAHKRILWSEPAGDSGALAGPILYGDVIVVQDVAGTIRAWRWEDWR